MVTRPYLSTVATFFWEDLNAFPALLPKSNRYTEPGVLMAALPAFFAAAMVVVAGAEASGTICAGAGAGAVGSGVTVGQGPGLPPVIFTSAFRRMRAWVISSSVTISFDQLRAASDVQCGKRVVLAVQPAQPGVLLRSRLDSLPSPCLGIVSFDIETDS